MGLIGVAIDKTQDAAKYLAKKGADLLEAERRATVKGALVFESLVRAKLTNDRLKVRTNTLRGSIGSGPVERAPDGAFEVKSGIRDGNARAYARIQEEGGTIRAKGEGYMTFKLPDGHWVSTREVTIPPKWYVRDSYVEMKARMPSIVQEEVARAVAGA